MLRGRTILLGVTGGIAAYKACEVARLLVKNRATVQVLMTDAATRFVSPLTFEALSGREVAFRLFDGEDGRRGHLDVTREADLMVIAPATANCLAKLACGLADDLLSTAALALQAPLLLCPAMNPRMFRHPAVQENLQTLRRRGAHLLDPAEGAMAHPKEEAGWGRLPEPIEILDRICRLLPPTGDLAGIELLISAGPTREPLDPIRFFSNYSSGKMGFALAAEARRRGAIVHFISGPSALPKPLGLDPIFVETAEQMGKAVESRINTCQGVIMAAAPADFRPVAAQTQKIKKSGLKEPIHFAFEKTPDILQNVGKNKASKIFVGFALETDEGLENARAKLKAKNLDLIILNHPRPQGGTGMGEDTLQASLITANGPTEDLPVLTKTEVASLILDRMAILINQLRTA